MKNPLENLIEKTQPITDMKQAAEYAIDNWTEDITPVIDFLKNQPPTEEVPNCFAELALVIRDSYNKDDPTPFIILGGIIEKLAKK